MRKNKSQEKSPEIKELREQLAVAEETLRAIRQGEVDALVVSTPQGDQVFTLKGAERPYRILMEKMKEGTVTLAGDDSIFYCNQGFADMLKKPLEKMIGTTISQFISPVDRTVFEDLLRQGRAGDTKGEVTFLAEDGTAVPTHLSVDTMLLDGLPVVYLVATDITKRKLAEEALQKAHDELEIKIQERTAEFVKANEELHIEITERKRAEEASRQSEGRLRLLSDLTMEGIVIHDKGIILDANEALARMFGYGNVSEVIGKSGFDLMMPESQQLLQQHIVTGSDEPYEAVGIKKDGMRFPIEIHGSNIKYKGKTVRTGVVRDLTERKRAEEALRQSEERFSKAFRSSPVALNIARLADGHFVDANESFLRLFEYSREEVIDHISTELNMYVDPNEQAQFIRILLEQGTISNYEVTLRTKTGKLIRVLFSAEMISINGQDHIISTLVDITERKRAEEALRESEQRYATTLASIGDAVISTDTEGRITFMNAEAEALTGWTLADALIKPVIEVFNIINEYTRRKADNPVIRVLQEGTIVGLANHTILVRKDGTEVPIDDSGAPIRDGGGKTMGVVLVFRDITERKQAEEALHESEQKFMKLFQGNAAAIALTRLRDRHIIEVNERWQEVLGFSCEEVIGRPANEIKLWKHPEEQMRAIHDLETNGAIRNRECEFFRKNGEVWTGLMSSEIIQLQGEGFILTSLVDITERKRTEEALRESEQRFRVSQELSPDGFTILRPVHDEQGHVVDFTWVYENATIARINGTDPNTVVGKRLLELFPSHRGTPIFQAYQQAAQTGQSQVLEAFYSGETLVKSTWFRLAVVSMGEYIVILAQDMTDAKQAEEALRKAHDELELRVQERTADLVNINKKLEVEIAERQRAEEAIKTERQRLYDVLETMPAMICLLTPDYHVAFSNKSFRERFGESHGRHCYDYCFGRTEPCEFCESYKVLETGQPHRWEVTGPDGSVIDAYDFPFTDVDGSPMILEMDIDITERKKALEKIREQATLLDNAQEAVGVRNLEHNLIYWNKGAQHLYGFSAEEAIGKNADRLVYKEETPQLIEAKRIVLEKGKWTGELHQVTRDGRDVIVESHWTLIYDSEGKPKSILVVNTDITEKKMFEAHLLRAQRMESIGILAGGIAHNLNNMLTPMMMSLHMLKQKYKDEQSQKLLNILEKNSQHSADLIKQVLSFSRGVEGERTPLQVKHLIAEIEKIAKETFPRNIEIRTDVQNDLFTISGDVTQLHQVIMNLCVNARDAMPDGGILNITASNFLIDENYARMHTEAKVGSYVAISVSDTGIGIPPKIVDRIFEPFFTTKEFGKGTGLGLSTALAIVKSHGGFIDIHSEVGKGTIFRVYLPATLIEMQNVEEQRLELLVGHGELVLVAEDEDSVREVTISTLKEYGYNVLAANDGADAVALYAQNKDKIKVVLMDMMMPVMDGEASIRAIRKINPQVKVIVVSGLAEKDKLAKIESTRAQALLPKPYTAEKLLKTIHEVLSAT